MCNEKKDSRIIYRCNLIKCQTRICKDCAGNQGLYISTISKRFSSNECPHCLQICPCIIQEKEGNIGKNSLNLPLDQNKKLIKKKNDTQVVLKMTKEKDKIIIANKSCLKICLKCQIERASNQFYNCCICGIQFCTNCLVAISEEEKLRIRLRTNWICLNCYQIHFNSEYLNKDRAMNNPPDALNLGQKNTNPVNYYFINQQITKPIQIPFVVPCLDNFTNLMNFRPSLQENIPLFFNPCTPGNLGIRRDSTNPFIYQRNDLNIVNSFQSYLI